MKDIIVKRRHELGMTQLELANKLNISDKVISKWETGRSLPDTSMLIPLCEVLEISIDELFGKDSDKNSYLEINQKELKLKFKNLTIFTLIYLIITTIIACIGRIIYDQGNYHNNYEFYYNLGVGLIILAIVTFIICLGITLIKRNLIINNNSLYLNYDKSFINIFLITCFIVVLVITTFFVALHGLSNIEQLTVIIIIFVIASLLFGSLLYLNKKTKKINKKWYQ